MQSKRRVWLYLLAALVIIWALVRFLIPELQKRYITSSILSDTSSLVKTNNTDIEASNMSYDPSLKGYTTKDGKAYWSDGYTLYEIYEADLPTFTIVHKSQNQSFPYEDWAKDKNHVYARHIVIADADPSSFQFINENFSKDKNRVFFTSDYETPHVKVITGADPATFQIINKNFSSFSTFFSKDKNRVFLNAEVLPDSDPESFVIINDDVWSKDKNQVYFNTIPIPNAHATTFQIVNDYFEKDKNQVYLQEKLVQGADPKTFQVLDINYSRDKNHIFVWGKEIVGADPMTFTPLDSRYAKDKNRVYYHSSGNAEIIEGADAKNFTALSPKDVFCAFAKDGKNVYREKNIFPVTEPKSFEVIDCDKAKDNTRTYNLGCCPMAL